MTCISPPELEEMQLLAFLDGEAPADVSTHIARCPHCRERAQQLRRLQSALTARLYRATCPSTMELGEYQLGLLPAWKASEISQHVSMCPHCDRELAQGRDFFSLPDPALGSDFLQNVVRRARVIVAQLVSGPGIDIFGTAGLRPALAGVRGADPAPYVYEAGDVQVILEIKDDLQRPNQLAIVGLVMGEVDAQSTEAHLWLKTQLVMSECLDDLGNFVFDSLAPGQYELILSGPEVEIHLQQMTVESR